MFSQPKSKGCSGQLPEQPFFFLSDAEEVIDFIGMPFYSF